ncbi:MAG: hypothetical protein H7Z12_10860 [Rhodospirillaceae bacterium]|nr:hypothetical protein [Rhodospirillales bacterium]
MLDLLFLGQTQSAILAYVLVFLALSTGIGRTLRLHSVAGAAFGFLVLSGSTALAMFALRKLALPIVSFAPLSAVAAALIVLVLRRVLPPGDRPITANCTLFWTIAAGLALVLWTLRVIQLDPSASLSSHHGWYPLYIQDSFKLGRFAEVADMAFGQGYLTSIFYNVDLMGVVALGEWLHSSGAWAAYSAASTLAAILSVVLVASALRHSRAALLTYAMLVLALLATDFLYRTTLARNWGDGLLFLGGAVMLFHMMRGRDLRSAALWTAAASLFLVFSRHYGAFYSGIILGLGFLAVWRLRGDRRLGPWIILGLLLVAFSTREIFCILSPPSPFYPGSRLLDTVPASALYLLVGSLNDLGLMLGEGLMPTVIGPRNLYLIAIIALLIHQRRRLARQPLRRLVYGAPFVLLLLPQLLQALIGYRSSLDYSKTTLIAIHVATFLPAFAVGRLLPDRALTRWPLWASGVGAVMVAALAAMPVLDHHSVPWRQGPAAMLGWAFQLYHDHNPDLNMAAQLRTELGPDFSRTITDRPILYVHYEPGLAIRHYVGGRFFCDLDFWSEPVQRHFAEAKSLQDLVARLNYPNIYLSFGPTFLYGRYFNNDWPRFAKEMAHLDGAAWIERTVRHNSGIFHITRPGAHSAGTPACPGAGL